MEVESTLARSHPGRYSNLEVIQHSNCLLVFCCIVGFFCFAVCLGIWMATSGLMTGFWLYIFTLFCIAGLICWSVVGWQFYLVKREKDDAHTRIKAEVRLLNETSTLVKDAVRRGDGIDFTRNDDKGITDVKVLRSAVLLAQAERGRKSHVVEAVQAPAAILPSRKLITPPAYDLIDIMRRFPLAPDNMFLGIDGYKSQVTCDPAVELCHGAFNAASGRGKTILIRGLETQLLKMGYEVVHADIKFTLIDEKGNDYRPIARSLLAQGDLNAGGLWLPHLITREEYIYQLLQWLAGPELTRRRAMYGAGDHSYSIFFLFLEELLYLTSIYKDLGPIIGRLLNVGRSLGIKVFCVAQNFQVQNLKINSGMRENFESAWYLGGDIKSAAAILDMTVKELEEYERENAIQLGKGVSVFRNNNVAYDARLMRGGMASNDFVYWMLGKADNFRLPDDILPPLEATGRLETRSNGLMVPAGYDGTLRGNNGTGFTGGVNGQVMVPQTPINVSVDSLNGASSVRTTGELESTVNPLVETVGAVPDVSLGLDDPRFTEVQEREFIKLYKGLRNRKECLRRMRNPNTQSGYGLGNRYDKHAKLLVEQYQLDKS